MKTKLSSYPLTVFLIGVVSMVAVVALPVSARASQAYGSINNFDVVNDTGVACHGFQIELDDITSAQITYTYDYNHYGTPVISTDSTDPAHPKTYVRYLAKYTNGAWSAYTAVPTNAIPSTMGHQFTDPSVNFGGEHFGVGYTANPTNVLYNWLQDDGTGNLWVGPAVSVSTPVFSYLPPVAPAAAPQIQPVIVPPPAPVVPGFFGAEFGPATWVKMITTTAHTNTEVQLRDLVTPDTNYPTVRGWANGELAEVETEWQVLQYDSGAPGGGINGILQGAAQSVNQGGDVVTTRYEFYKYPTNPVLFDPETYEALAQTVASDGIHGTGSYSNIVVVGDFIGAQMSAATFTNPVGLIDHLQDGNIGTAYPDRLVAVSGGAPISVVLSGVLPQGMSLNTNYADTNCGLLTGTPTAGGAFQFAVGATDYVHPSVSRTYILNIAAPGVQLPAHASVTVTVTPPGSGTVSGTGDFQLGQSTTLVAQTNSGYKFTGWSEASIPLTNALHYTLSVNANHDLLATFTNTGATNPVTNPVVTNPVVTNAVGTNAQTITFATNAPVKFSAGSVTLNAMASSGLPVSFALVSGPASLANSTLSLLGVGTVKVKATQSGNSTYKAAVPVTNSIIVSLGNQSITFPPIMNQTYGVAPFGITLPTSSSGLNVGLNATPSTIVSLTNGILTVKGAGNATLVASQAGNSNYLAATSVTNHVVISKTSQSITFPTISDRSYSATGFTITLPTSSSGLAVSLSAGPTNVVTRSASTLTMKGVGTATLIATQAGSNNYLAATPVTNSFVISKASQTITFNPTATNTFRTNATIALNATDSAGLPVSYSSDNQSVLTISGATATMKSKGTVNVTASQAGNTNYSAATSVTKPITLK